MDTTTVSLVIVGTAGAMIASMAGLIKTMVTRKLDEIQASVNGLTAAHHKLDKRVTRLEAEHRLRHCITNGGENDE